MYAELEEEFRLTLFHISELLTTKDVKAIIWIKGLTEREKESIGDDPLELLKVLEARDVINIHKMKELRRLLRRYMRSRKTYVQAKLLIKAYQKKYRQVTLTASTDTLSPTTTPTGPQLNLLNQHLHRVRESWDEAETLSQIRPQHHPLLHHQLHRVRETWDSVESTDSQDGPPGSPPIHGGPWAAHGNPSNWTPFEDSPLARQSYRQPDQNKSGRVADSDRVPSIEYDHVDHDVQCNTFPRKNRRTTAEVLPGHKDQFIQVIISNENLAGGVTNVRIETTPRGSTRNLVEAEEQAMCQAAAEKPRSQSEDLTKQRRCKLFRQEALDRGAGSSRSVGKSRAGQLLSQFASCVVRRPLSQLRGKRHRTRLGGIDEPD